MMDVGKSIVFKIDSELWARFKGKIASEDARIGNLIKHWIKDYTDPPKREVPREETPEVPVKSDKAISRPKKQARESLESATNKGEPAEAEPVLVSLQDAGIDFADVEEYAKRLKIDLAGKTQEEAAFFILDCIFKDYESHHADLSKADFFNYKEANISMLTWYEKFKGYGADPDEDEDDSQIPEGGEDNETTS